ncbi:hypothetical protein ON010_g2933 [Phytophthora cinnamomi]|nr:hypothetical protein ON010_g2933 [Phytophthora cinnamomi]
MALFRRLPNLQHCAAARRRPCWASSGLRTAAWTSSPRLSSRAAPPRSAARAASPRRPPRCTPCIGAAGPHPPRGARGAARAPRAGRVGDEGRGLRAAARAAAAGDARHEQELGLHRPRRAAAPHGAALAQGDEHRRVRLAGAQAQVPGAGDPAPAEHQAHGLGLRDGAAQPHVLGHSVDARGGPTPPGGAGGVGAVAAGHERKRSAGGGRPGAAVAGARRKL